MIKKHHVRKEVVVVEGLLRLQAAEAVSCSELISLSIKMIILQLTLEIQWEGTLKKRRLQYLVSSVSVNASVGKHELVSCLQ